MHIKSDKILKTKFFLAFLITVGCFVFTYLYYDFFYVEYEGLFDGFYSGNLTGGMPFRSIYFLGNIGTSYLYSILYEMNPHVEWISWIMYGYLFVSCLIGMYITLYLIPDRQRLWMKVIICIAVYLMVFADHNIHFIFTRVSYMVTGLSLIGLVFFFREAGSIRGRPWLFLFFNVGFVIGTLTRSESATAALLLVGCFGIFYLQQIWRLVVVFIFPCIFLLSLLVAIAYDLRTSKDFYKQVEPDIEAQFTDRDNAVPLSDMKTYRDTVMWRAAADIMWPDPKTLSPNYMRSLIKSEKMLYTDARQWNRVRATLADISSRFWYLGWLCALLGFGLLIRYKFSSRLSFMLGLGFIASFWVLTAIQIYTVKINDRSFAPLISIFIFCHLILLLPYLSGTVSKRLWPVLLGIVILFGIHLYHLKAEANQLKQDFTAYQKNLSLIHKLAAGKILAVNSSSCDYLFLSNKPFHPFDLSAFKKVYITDGFNIPFLPYYRRYLEEDCRCDMNEFPSFWDYLRRYHTEVVIVSTVERMDILREYMKVIHKYQLPVMESNEVSLLKLQKSDFRGSFANLKVYELGP